MQTKQSFKLLSIAPFLLVFFSLELYADYCNNPTNVVMTRDGTSATITWDDNGSYCYYWCISTSSTFVAGTPTAWPEASTIYYNGTSDKVKGIVYTNSVNVTNITSTGTLYAYVAGVNSLWEWCAPEPGSAGAPAPPASSAPSVSTNSISTYTHNSAILGGNVTNDGGETVNERGVVYSSSDNTPTIAEGATKNPNGSGTGTFSENSTGLSLGTTYYVRAYAINSAGTGYGDPKSFTTYNIPSVSTTAASSIKAETASSGGYVSSSGGLSVTSRGVCWNTTGSPTTANPKTTDGSGTGSFSSYLTGLNQGTTYYVRAYAANSAGTAYGNQVYFTTNTRPIANNDTYTRYYTDIGTAYNVPPMGVLTNDTDAESAYTSLSVALPRPVSNVSHGSLTLYSNGSFSYTPVNGYKENTDSFTYYASDGTDNSSTTATVTISIVTPCFTGGGSNNYFSNPNNWNAFYVPNESLNIIIANGQHMEVDMNYSCKNLKFEAASSFTCISGHSLTITGNVLNKDNIPAIEMSNSMVIWSSISINNE